MSVLGKWRIVELPGYADDYADMVEPAYILFEAAGGEFAFGCVTGGFAGGGDHAAIEFDWTGNDEMDAACGSGWAELQADGSLHGGIGFLAGDEILFIARRWPTSSTACSCDLRRIWPGLPPAPPPLVKGFESMSQIVQSRRVRAVDLAKFKAEGRKIIALTAYHAHTASILDRHCDVILVGDSLGMVMHGLESTLPVTLEMIVQAQAVMRGTTKALVVVDIPFGSYEVSREQAFLSAARVLKETGAGAIKLEGGAQFADTIAFLTRRGIPVMVHIALTPQSVNTMGGFRVQG